MAQWFNKKCTLFCGRPMNGSVGGGVELRTDLRPFMGLKKLLLSADAD